ncbi:MULTISPECIES: hypothetical protein [Stenotrophomonas]|uniref:hypothetical protein n=1 Tax=Stenotrophomonas TaxID=40323 RepID=UPI000889AB4B|nr:hypothetical protein [Stenotrophomonas pavanii]SDK71116.1 hypothetical protein SAMN04487784_3093 [Stenotrophomonas pavanii]
MKITSHNGHDLIIQSRDHCDPHVHIKSPNWDVRLRFSFWKDDVEYWDTRPVRNKPAAALIESLRRALMDPQALRRARREWWRAMGSTCVENKQWILTQEVVSDVENYEDPSLRIIKSSFDNAHNRTLLILENGDEVEIEL